MRNCLTLTLKYEWPSSHTHLFIIGDIKVTVKNNNKGYVQVPIFYGLVWFMLFNNISAILWRSVLLLEETRVPGEKHRPAARH